MPTTSRAPSGGDAGGDPEEQQGPLLDRASVEAVRSMVRAALVGESGEPVAPPELDWSSLSVDRVLDAAVVHRVVPLVAAVIGTTDAPSDAVEQARAIERATALRALRLVAEAARSAAVLGAAAVPFLQYKGVPLALQTTRTAVGRGAGDIDLLVPPVHLPRAHAALAEAGWDGLPIDPDAWWWPWYLRMRRERAYAGGASHIDLHWRIAWHGQPMPPVERVIDRATVVPIGGVDVPTLAIPDALATACYSATMDRFARLRSMVDIVRLVRRPDAALPTGASWRLRRLVGEAVAFADDLVGGVPPQRLACLAPPGRVDTARIRRLWESSSVAPLWMEQEMGLGGMVQVYREPLRYAGAGPALLMAASDGLLPPERLAEVERPTDVPLLVGRELVDLVRVRMLRRSR